MGICDLEGVVRNAQQEAWLAERRARAEQQNALRSLVGLPAVAPDTIAPSFGPSIYCRTLARLAGWLSPEELQAREQRQDSVARVVTGQLGRPARPIIVPGTAPQGHISQLRVHRDRARAARVREAVYSVELNKKYAIPAACIVFVLVAIPIAIRFPRGGVGLVISASLAVFLVYYVFLIAGETLANRLIVAPFWVMWAPNVIMGLLGTGGLWWIAREGTAAGGWRRRLPRQRRASAE